MSHDAPAYGLWTVAVLNAVVFIIFAFSFTKPKTADSDDVGRAFRNDVGHRFRSKSAGRSD